VSENKYETSWSLKLQAKGVGQTRAMAREVRALDAAMRALGESSGNLSRVSNDVAVVRSTHTRIRAERSAADATAREQARLAREQERTARETARAERAAAARTAREQARVRTEISDSEMVRRSVARSRDRYDRLQAAESTGRVRRQQRAEQLAARDSVAVGQRSARQNAMAFRASQRSQERDIARRARTERGSAERIARLNAAAFRRNNQADSNRILANDRARQRAAQREVSGSGRTSLSSTLSFLRANAALGIVGGIASASWRALSALVEMAQTIGGIVFSLTSATLEMIAFREASLTTLRAMARDSAGNRLTGAAADREARGQYQFAQEFARQTPLDTAQVLDLQRQTSAAGFSGARNREVVQAAADVGAFNPNDPSAASRFLLGLGQLRNASTVRLQDLRQTSQAAGLGENDILREIARNAGMTQRAGETDAAYNTRIQRAQQGGRFTGAQGVEGVLAALRARNGGELGSFARSQGGTLTGTLSNLRGAVLDFVTSIDDIENLPGIRALKKTLNEVVSVLTGAGPVAQRLRATFAGIVNEVTLFAGGLTGKTGVEGVVTMVLDTMEQVWPIVREVTTAFGSGAWQGLSEGLAPFFAELRASRTDWRTIAATAGIIGRSFGRLVAFDVKALAKIASLLAEIIPVASELTLMVIQITESFQGLGSAIVDGVRQGFTGEGASFLSEVRQWGMDIGQAARDALEIHSPSLVFERIGEMIPAGMRRGIETGAPGVDSAVRGLGAPQGLPGFGGRALTGTIGNGNLTLNATFNISLGVGDLAGGTLELGRSLAEHAWSQIVERVEAAHQGGG